MMPGCFHLRCDLATAFRKLGIQIICLLIVLLSSSFANNLPAQDSTVLDARLLTSRYLQAVTSKAGLLEQSLDRKTEKLLQQLRKQDARIKRKISKIDSTAAKEIFVALQQRHGQLQQKLNSKLKTTHYIAKLDTLATSMKFLKESVKLLSPENNTTKKLNEALAKLNHVKDQFEKAEDVKQFLRDKKQFLKDNLEHLGLTKELRKVNKQAYYYGQQVNQYKSILKDSRRAEKKALQLLSGTKLFRDFMRKNSQIASLFHLPNDPDGQLSSVGLAGLQTRVRVNELIQQQISSSGPGGQEQFRQNIRNAQSQLDQLKNKVNQYGGQGSDDIMPEGFRPNDQKTKTFFRRLEYGFNIQSQKATYFFPVTTDIGLSLGYKLNDKAVIGIGVSYKMGWGRGWNNINVTHQGLGLRSYVDVKLKKSFWLAGGYEQNYRSDFNNFSQLKERNAWQQSGLIGLSKIVSLRSKVFRKTKLQLLWDFLSYEQIPKPQPLLFRINYSLK